MKRVIAALLTLTIAISFSACADVPQREPTIGIVESDDGASISYSAGNASYTLSKIPYDMIFSEVVVPLERITFFEIYANHGYTPYIVVALNRENLSDDDIYWMTRYDEKTFNRELSMDVYVDSDENALKSEKLTHFSSIYDDEYLYFFFTGELSRYSYNGSKFGCQIVHSPTAIYKDDTVFFYYFLMVDDTNYSDSDSVLTEGERSLFYLALDDYLNN